LCPASQPAHNLERNITPRHLPSAALNTPTPPAGNVALWYYAQQNAPAKKQKKVGAKKVKREALKQGIRVLGD
jgi:hypothetical protein